MWFAKKKKAAVTGELPMELSPTYQQTMRSERLAYVEMGYWAHVGIVRQMNEDSFAYSEERMFTYNEPSFVTIAVIADGMGGLDLGEEASARAVRLFMEQVRVRLLPLLRERSDRDGDAIEALLKAIVIEINAQLHDYFQSKNERSGSTLSAVVLCDDVCHIVHVGDSRVYCFDQQERTLVQLTDDHSYVFRLVQMGELDAEAARNHPRKNEIYKMLAFESSVEPDYVRHVLTSGQGLLLCTDGLTDMVSDVEIGEQLFSSSTLQESVAALGHLANAHGGYDNCTILYVYPVWRT